MAETRKFHCPSCRKNITATAGNCYRKHDRETGTECSRSRKDIPAWLLQRGPETGPEDDTPVIGRDYAPCPECSRSPLLDGATGCYVDHTTEPRGRRCAMSGKPYESEDRAADAADSAPPEAEEMISKWAATVKKIEDKQLPPSSPESTTTPKGSPQRPDAPKAPPCASTGSGTPAAPSTVASTPKSGNGAPAPTTVSLAASTLKTASTESATVPRPTDGEVQRPDGAPSIATGTHPRAKTVASTASAEAPKDAEPVAAAPEAASSSANGIAKRMPYSADATSTTLSGRSTAPLSTAPTPGVIAISADRTPADAPTATATTATEFSQPGSPFSQPGKIEPAPAAVPMSVEGEQVAAALKQLFFDYDHRRSGDNRGAQAHLGPSEIGSPCDRRLAMALLGIPAVNAGGDGWSAFVGTAVHEALSRMFEWANAGSGRYAVETLLNFPNEHVPKGTADLLDRTLCMVGDHKVQGKWSQSKLRSGGIPPGYRVQLHVYGFGQRLKGERVDHVALISWPRESSSLDNLYVIVEEYDPAVARDALSRVDRIAELITALDHEDPLKSAREFPVADDCAFCPFFAPGDASMERGCNGRT
ncbi:hypothetical protein [Streptomyces sp. NPDC059009]|uniref:hypothetical protein n=1 Tax=Streptomyces sp. NPDC059009 TaxID=3346694 RepID=UPI0036907317